jgi:hypothetical protein
MRLWSLLGGKGKIYYEESNVYHFGVVFVFRVGHGRQGSSFSEL